MIDSPSPELQDVVDIFSTIKQVCALCLMDFTSLCLRAHRGARRHDASISTYMPCLALPACHRARHLTTDPSGMRNTRIRANQFKTNDCNVARARSLSLRHVTIIFFPLDHSSTGTHLYTTLVHTLKLNFSITKYTPIILLLPRCTTAAVPSASSAYSTS